MTCRSEDEGWEEVERRRRLEERLRLAAHYLAMLSLFSLAVFALVYFAARHSPERRTDQWHLILESARGGG